MGCGGKIFARTAGQRGLALAEKKNGRGVENMVRNDVLS
jgi:hypothetical protein